MLGLILLGYPGETCLQAATCGTPSHGELASGKYEFRTEVTVTDAAGRKSRDSTAPVTVTVDSQDLTLDFGTQRQLKLESVPAAEASRPGLTRTKVTEVHDVLHGKILESGQLKGAKVGVFVNQDQIEIRTFVIEGNVTESGARGTLQEVDDSGRVLVRGTWELRAVEKDDR